jgi:hypothetical protein
MEFLEFKTKTQFTQSDLSHSWFIKNHNELKVSRNNWKSIKSILLHKDCPFFLKDEYASNPIWWKRFPVLLSNRSWVNYFNSAIKDPSSTIRQAAYKRVLFDQNSTNIIPLRELFILIRNDKKVHNYFNYKFIKALTSSETIEDFINIYEVKCLLNI